MNFTLPSENRGATATMTVNTGTVDPEYPPANLVDLLPEIPAKLLTLAGSFVAALGSAKQVDRLVIVHHNLYGATVTLQANTADSWASPPFSQVVTIPAPYADNYPKNATLNIAALGIARTYAFWRLLIAGALQAVSIGELRLEGAEYTLPVLWDSVSQIDRPAIEHVTEGGKRRSFDLGSPNRTYSAEVLVSDATQTLIDNLHRDAYGIIKPFTVIPDPVETSEPMLVQWVSKNRQQTHREPNIKSSSIEFVEMSRGLYP